MAEAVVSLISMAFILTGMLVVTGSSCSSVESLYAAWDQMVRGTEDLARTRLSLVSHGVDLEGVSVKITLRNTGRTALARFPRWDVMVQYYGRKFQGQKPYFIKWLPFAQGVPGDNQWTVEGIFEDAQTNTPEVFQPGILNPGEEVRIHIRLKPKVGAQTTNWALVVPAQGTPTPVIFTR